MVPAAEHLGETQHVTENTWPQAGIGAGGRQSAPTLRPPCSLGPVFTGVKRVQDIKFQLSESDCVSTYVTIKGGSINCIFNDFAQVGFAVV